MRFLLLILFISCISFFNSCDTINPAEKTPTYLHVDSFQFIPTPNTGTASHKIVAVTAYVDYVPVGTFDLPANIPVLAEKSGQLLLMPVVSYSGLRDVVVPYHFYRADTSTFTPKPGQTIFYTPKTHYLDSSLVFVHEDFESGNSFVGLQGDTLRRTSDPKYVFEGSYGGVVELKDSLYSESIMSLPFTAATLSAEAYLEINYKGTAAFVIGLQTTVSGTNVSQYLYGFNPRSDWNKVYVGLQDFLTQYPRSTYRVVLKVQRQDDQPGYVAFDNFKLVTTK